VDVVPEVDPQGSEHIREFIRSHPEGFVSVEDAAAAVASFHGEPFPQAKLASLARNLRTGPDGKLYWHWDPARLREGAFACNDIALLNDAASRLALPALLLRGEFSGIVTDKGVTALQRLVPQLQVQVIPGAGHDIPRDNYPAYEQALLAFLGDARASSG
ncbi:MAG TPA: hypothetical protein VLK85_27470, partial [Ramlibacter sp.]|nr:hypothetical protein [Ramlibacter sp.]